jgi:hypothetical protein
MEIIKSLSDLAVVLAFVALAMAPQAMGVYFAAKEADLK